MFALAVCVAFVAHAAHTPARHLTLKNESFAFEFPIFTTDPVALERSGWEDAGLAQQTADNHPSDHVISTCRGRRRRTLRLQPLFSTGGKVCQNGAGGIWDAQYCYSAHAALKKPLTMSYSITNTGGCHIGKFSFVGNGEQAPRSICIQPKKPKGLFREDTVYFQTGGYFLRTCDENNTFRALAADGLKDAVNKGAHRFIVNPMKNRRLIHHADTLHLLSASEGKKEFLGAKREDCARHMVKRGMACVGVGPFASYRSKAFVIAKKRGRGQLIFGEHISLMLPHLSTALIMTGTCCHGRPCVGGLPVHKLHQTKQNRAFFKLGFSHHKGDICCRTLRGKRAKCRLGGSHVRTFDGLRLNVYDVGLVWIVKNECSMIQAIYTKHKNVSIVIGHLAIGGNSLLGHKLKLDARRKTHLFWDDKGVRTLSWIMGVSAAMRERRWFIKLPCRLEVTSVALGARLNWLDVTVTSQKPLKGVDGHCGNFNQLKADDSRAEMKKRKAWRVNPCSSLFASGVKQQAEPRLSLQNCPASNLSRVMRMCKSTIPHATPNYERLRKSCVFDACFVTRGIANMMQKTAARTKGFHQMRQHGRPKRVNHQRHGSKHGLPRRPFMRARRSWNGRGRGYSIYQRRLAPNTDRNPKHRPRRLQPGSRKNHVGWHRRRVWRVHGRKHGPRKWFVGVKHPWDGRWHRRRVWQQGWMREQSSILQTKLGAKPRHRHAAWDY
eukprot:TRINITY_DN8468_c0_g2_i1.p1 TRINITY_DN8468_c0_g2~~TRINITY_DN8468_c0_g2_i1.p1  ORF type:complete len:721 (-),score=83.37 TRINITY_DN8468_c0_g2_i1:482-2644(-)